MRASMPHARQVIGRTIPISVVAREIVTSRSPGATRLNPCSWRKFRAQRDRSRHNRRCRLGAPSGPAGGAPIGSAGQIGRLDRWSARIETLGQRDGALSTSGGLCRSPRRPRAGTVDRPARSKFLGHF